MPPPRALVGVAPALVVVAGSFLLGRVCLKQRDELRDKDVDVVAVRGETMLWPTKDDEDRLHRVALKQETAEDLLIGRLTLAEAIERYETLAAGADGPQGPGDTDAERAINQVLSFARIRAAQAPQRYAARKAELESEARTYATTR